VTVAGIGSVFNAIGFAQPATRTAAVAPAGTETVAPSGGNVFTNMLESLEATQDNADTLAQAAATGNLVDVHNYTIAATEAQLMTQLTVAVRDRAVESFTEIMRMQI
jgi:flagellar hook-basal body complex protein FliE